MQKYNTYTNKIGAKKVVNGYVADFYRELVLYLIFASFDV